MMPRAKSIYSAILLAAMAVPAMAQKVGRMDGYTQPKQTSLEKLRKNPEAYKGVWVTFEVQFGGLSRVYNPFFTKFVSTDFVSFSAWSAKQKVWMLDEFRNDYHYLFVDKRSNTAIQVYAMKKFQRAKIVGYVRNTFQGAAWIDVTRVEALENSMNQATLFHFVRGRTLMKESKWKLAQAELSKASTQPGLPPTPKSGIWSDLATCYLRQGEFPKAEMALQVAMETTPKDPDVLNLAKQMKTKPVSAMDHHTRVAKLKDWEGPLWRDKNVKTSKTRKTRKIPAVPTKVTTPPGAPKGREVMATPPAGR